MRLTEINDTLNTRQQELADAIKGWKMRGMKASVARHGDEYGLIRSSRSDITHTYEYSISREEAEWLVSNGIPVRPASDPM